MLARLAEEIGGGASVGTPAEAAELGEVVVLSVVAPRLNPAQ